MTDEQKFFTFAEDRKRECKIEYPIAPAAEGEDGIPSGVQEITLTHEALKELESAINDPSKKGCKIQIDKLIAAAAEDAAAKGGKAPPAKGKPPVEAAGKESKPISGEAWLDLTPFMFSGSTESTQRIFFNTNDHEVVENEEKSQNATGN